ncbi:toprim domain-containing protein [Clostridium tertium]|uniref:toprim domain-containing protein n=1 Tax=Clostridium tertium TaxID=1559 RepID=UPI0023B32EA9|nr:toprim domain-containing protein [Clostridium tertium]
MLEIDDIRDILTTITDKLYNSQNQDFYREKVAEFRGLKKETLENIKGFYVQDPIKDILPIVGEDIFFNPVFGFYPGDNMYRERFILPVWTVDKKVMGFIGYDNLSTFRYLLSETEGFKKRTSVYGLNNINKILDEDYLIVVEGHFDERRLFELNYPIFALQGTAYPPFLKQLVKPLKGIIHLLDKDAAGLNAVKYNRNIHKNSVVMYLPKGEDPDSYLKDVNNQVAFKEAVDEVIRYNFMKSVVILKNSTKVVV